MATAITENIFDIFKKHKVPVNGVLYPRYISAGLHLWDKQHQDSFASEMNELVRQGLVTADNDAYRLTQTGYNQIYKHYTIQDTVDLIMGDFRRRRIGKNEILLLPALLSTLQDADRYHLDNYDQAVKLLVKKGWLLTNGRGFVLTEEGYSEVYPD
jgi:hypothetical protein